MFRYFLLLFLFSNAAAWAEGYQFVLDLDRTLMSPQLRPMSAADSDYFSIGNEHYRMAAYTPEFLVALGRTINLPTPAPRHLVVFSGGGRERNQAATQAIRVFNNRNAAPIFSRVLSFDDLTLNRPLPPGVARENALDYVRSMGGQDQVAFFDLFKKDLQIVSPGAGKIDRTIIFDDNVDITPLSQMRNVLVVARPDVNDEDLVKPGSPLSKVRQASRQTGIRSPTQIARAKYRLVRAIGLLDLASRLTASGKYSNLCDAIDDLQWNPDGSFRSRLINSKEIYERGMQILGSAYREVIQPGDTAHVRPEDYFRIRPTDPIPSALRCEVLAHLSGPGLTAAMPWD